MLGVRAGTPGGWGPVPWRPPRALARGLVLIRCDGGEDRVGHDTLVMGFFIGPEAGVDAVVVQQGSAQAD
jgi:hypothetical protein